MTEEKRTLIETFLPVDEISEEAKLEKLGNAKPPMSSLHYWWTRKPLITARAATLGALLPWDFDPQEFKKLLGLEYVRSTGKRAHNYDIPLDRIKQLEKEYKRVWGEVPSVLDPFAGGGSIPFEAMRIGVDTISNDYNNVAFLIEKATLEYPSIYGEKIYNDVKKGLNWIFEETEKELGQYYPKHNGVPSVAYIWSWKARCPKCGFDNPLVGQWWLVKKEKNNQFLEWEINDGKIKFSVNSGKNAPERNCEGGKGKCLNCNSVIDNDTIRKEIFEREAEELLSVVLSVKNGKEYVIPSSEDLISFTKTKEILELNFNEWVRDGFIPIDEMPGEGSEHIRIKIYLKYWHRLLNPRQKLLFVTLIKNIQRYVGIISNDIKDENYKIALTTYFAFILGKEIDYKCRSTTWHRQNQQIAHVLTFRRPGILWDHVEVNPFEKGSGSLVGINESILKSLKYSIEKLSNSKSIKINRQSVSQLSQKTSLIITDPPYFDDVQYAELSEMFYLWERCAIKPFFDPGEIQKSEDMSVGGVRDKKFFNKMFSLSCQKMFSALNENGLLVMFFAHSSVEAWDFVVNSLQKTGFRITATWPVHTESTTNPLAKGNASIMSSIIIVARKRKSDKSGYIEEIKDDVRIHLMKRLDEFWAYGLRGADLTVSAMGATLDIITQYSEIKSYTGEMQIKDVLELVQSYVAQYVLNRYMKNVAGLDAATSFYLYTRLSRLEAMPFDTANLIAKSMNVDLKLFEKQGLIKSSEKGTAKGIVLLSYSNREVNAKQSLIDCVQFVMGTFGKGGYTEVERELATIPFSRNEIKDVLEALLSLPTEDPERQVAQKILERMSHSFPKQGQTGLDNF